MVLIQVKSSQVMSSPTSVRAKLYKPAVGVRVRARSAPAHPLGDETHVTSHYMRTMSHLTREGSVISIPTGLAPPFGGADHWVVSDPCSGRGA